MVLTKHSKIIHIYNGEDDDTNKKMMNASDSITLSSSNENNNELNTLLEQNGSKAQFETNSTNEKLSEQNKSSPNYDIDKFITISKVKLFYIKTKNRIFYKRKWKK